jgi:GTP-binding protein HflX
LGALIDRKGHVQYVMVGDNKGIELPDFKRVRVASGRFRGLRCVHTHLRGEPLTQDDLTDLALLRLDLMAAIDVESNTGLPGMVRAAHLLPLHSGELGQRDHAGVVCLSRTQDGVATRLPTSLS